MAVSAFKSTSKRGNLGTSSSSSRTNTPLGKEISENSPKKVPPRRSRSVSAVSRAQLDMTSEFLNKRDNPLFWSSGVPPDNGIESKLQENDVGVAKFNEIVSKFTAENSKVGSIGDGDSRRGRSASRNTDAGNQFSGGRKGVGRSLSRVDTGRRGRSVSRCPVARGLHGSSESEVEQECSLSKSYRNRSSSNLASNNVLKVNLVRNSESSDQMTNPRTWSSHHPPSETLDRSAESLSCSQIPNWEDGGLTSSFSEVEEKTIKAVCEQMKSFQGDHLGGDTTIGGIYETVRSEVRRAISDIQNDLESAIRRNNTTTTANTNVADIPADLVSPGGVELVLDIRREYAKELEQSQERARKLRADLVLEEHRGQELSRILKELLPDPKTSNVQKSRPGRKNSIERRKMSKRLTEEAMAYFDECVSISTFDNSDFSSQEDPSLDLVGATIPIGYNVTLPQESGSQGQPTHIHESSGLTASCSGSSSNEPIVDQVSRNGANSEQGRKYQFSFAREPIETFGLQDDIKKYIKNFEKSIDKAGVNSRIVKSNYYDVDEYNLQGQAQSLLFDRVFLKNRVESGSILICGGGIAISVSPFASII